MRSIIEPLEGRQLLSADVLSTPSELGWLDPPQVAARTPMVVVAAATLVNIKATYAGVLKFSSGDRDAAAMVVTKQTTAGALAGRMHQIFENLNYKFTGTITADRKVTFNVSNPAGSSVVKGTVNAAGTKISGSFTTKPDNNPGTFVFYRV